MTTSFRKTSDEYWEQLSKIENALENKTPSGDEVLTFKGLKLPPITLPEFDGESNWNTFWDKFKGLVHDRVDIPIVNKLSYLLEQLKGTAKELVSELSITEDNYQIALKIMKENFEDKDLTLQRMVYKLLDMPGPKHVYKELQSFRITLSCTLKSLGTQVDLTSASWLINHIVQKKLPQSTCDELYHRYKKNYFTYQEVEEGLRELCKHLQSNRKESNMKIESKPENKGMLGKNKPKSNKEKGSPFKKEDIGTYTTSVQQGKPSVGNVLTESVSVQESIPKSKEVPEVPRPMTNNKSESRKICLLCNEQHPTVYCKNYPDMMTRMIRLSEVGKCLVCLSSRHTTMECNTNILSCFRCNKGTHHSALCPRTKEKQPTSANMSMTLATGS